MNLFVRFMHKKGMDANMHSYCFFCFCTQVFKNVFRDTDYGGQDVKVLSLLLFILVISAVSDELLYSLSLIINQLPNIFGIFFGRFFLKYHLWKQFKGAQKQSHFRLL